MGCEPVEGEDAAKAPEGMIILRVTPTKAVCPSGQAVGKKNLEEGKIPVVSCEGSCIRGEISRMAANIVAKEEPYRRICHGEILSAPHSELFRWFMQAPKVLLIDGCFLRCQGRIIENMVDADRLVQFDALSHYKKYSQWFYRDSVPEEEKQVVAQDVADWVLESMRNVDA
ncbi:MAG: putative zinc-binding protein [Candidatus Thermoplasmatota archaeon]|nr:putative zinc-binding protein [Candidatus Thermoplasmatota archaeon]